MASIDYIVAELTCFHCGHTSSKDYRTGLATSLRGGTSMHYLDVGDRLYNDPSQIEESNFYRVQKPHPWSPIRLMMPWHCPACRQINWGAEIVVDGGIIERITARRLTRQVLEELHYILDDCIDVAQSLTEMPLEELYRRDVIRTLRESLGAEGVSVGVPTGVRR
jgi:hypothetical protein